MKKHMQTKQNGFTIIELMISTVVFSLILLMSMVAILQITKLYYRGITQTSTQEATRAITDEISQAIQFSNSKVFYPLNAEGNPANPAGPLVAANVSDTEIGDIGFFCLGGKRYTFAMDRQLHSKAPDRAFKQRSSVFIVDRPETGCADSGTAGPLNLNDQAAVDSSEGVELLKENMRITKLSIAPLVIDERTSTNVWQIKVAVAYGDEELLEVDDSGTPDNTSDDRRRCKPSGPGVEFCATSEISTTVRRRVE